VADGPHGGFGRGPGGEPLVCHWIPNQWPPIYTGFWVASNPLYGQQDIGAPCPGPKSAAQAPDGRPMVCLGAQGWQPGTLTGASSLAGVVETVRQAVSVSSDFQLRA